MDVSIDTIIAQSGTPVSLPEVFTEINQLTQDPNCSVADLTRITESDLALSQRILEIVNSSYFDFPSSINSIARAITIMGSHDMRDLLLATTTIELLAQKQHKQAHIQSLWRHSLYCAVIARMLAESLQLERTECFFASGLLHDVGRLILFQGMPEATHEMITQAGDTGQHIHEIEQSILGYTHTDIGGRIAQYWGLPDRIVEAIRFHHQPELASNFPRETAIIHIANHMATSFDDDKEGPEYRTSRIDHDAWKRSGLTMELINDVLDRAPSQFNELYSILMPEDEAA